MPLIAEQPLEQVTWGSSVLGRQRCAHVELDGLLEQARPSAAHAATCVRTPWEAR